MKKNKYMSILLLVMLTIQACGPKHENREADLPVPVKTAKVEYKEFSFPVVISGVVSSKREARLSFKTGGIINKLYVKAGDEVRKGQLLATLDMTEINAQVLQAKNGKDKAQRDFERVENLFKENAATKEQMQNVQTALEIAEQSYKIAKFNQQYSSVYATESGRVIQKFMNEGELASPGMPVYYINSSQKDDWIIKTGVADKDWARLKKGDKAAVTIDAYPGEIFNAHITEISEAADPFSGTFQIELQISPDGKKLATGLVAKAEISPAKSDKFFLVPIEALSESNKKEGSVFTVDEKTNSVKKHKVEIAKILLDKVAIKSGLNDIQEVITDGLAYLTEESKVKIVK